VKKQARFDPTPRWILSQKKSLVQGQTAVGCGNRRTLESKRKLAPRILLSCTRVAEDLANGEESAQGSEAFTWKIESIRAKLPPKEP
jgi:hypothetical protein